MAESVEDILRDIRSSLRGGGGGSIISSGGGSGGGGGSGALGTIGAIANTAASGLNALYNSSLKTKDVLDVVTTAFNALPLKIPVLSNLVGSSAEMLGKTLINTNDSLNEVGKYGVNLRNNVTDYADKLASAGITQQQYTEMMRRSSTELNGIGSTMNKSQSNFLAFEKGLRETEFVNLMRQAGVSAAEVAEVGEAAMVHKRGIDLADETAKRRAITSAIELAGAMEENTRITGISRQQQLDDLKAAKKDAKVSVTNRKLGPGGTERYDAMRTAFATLGPGVQKFADEVWTGGIKTKEGATMFSALKDAGPVLEKAIKLQQESAKNSTDLNLKRQADEAMEAAKLAVVRRQNEEDFIDSVQYVKGGYGDAVSSIETGSQLLGPMMAGQAEAKTAGKDASLAAVAADQKKSVRSDIAGLDEKTGAPLKDVGTKIGQTLNNVDRTLGDASAGLAKSVNSAVSSLNTFGEELTKLNNTILKPRTAEQAQEIPKDIIKSITPTTTSTKTPEELVRGVQKPTEQKVEPKNSFADGTPGIRDFLKGGGSFDNLFQKFNSGGELALLHGDEMVANKSQMNEFRSQLTSHIGSIINGIGADKNPYEEISNEILKVTEELPVAKTEEKLPDLSGIATNLQNSMAPLDPTIIASQFEDITKEITPPNYDETFKNIDNNFNNVFEKFEIPDFDDMFSNIEDTFSDMSDDFELPDVGEMFSGIGDSFSTMADEFEPPDITGIFNDIGNTFSDLQKKIMPDEKETKTASADVLKDIKPKPMANLDTPKSGLFKGMFDMFNKDFTKPNADTTSNTPLQNFGQIKSYNDLQTLNTSKVIKEPEKPAVPPPTPTPPAPTAPPVPLPVASSERAVTLKDLLDELAGIHAVMSKIATSNAEISNDTKRQVKATKGLSGNRIA